MTSDIAVSGAACTTGATPSQVVQLSSENDSGGNYFSGSAKISTFGTRVEVLNHYFFKILYTVHNYIKINYLPYKKFLQKYF